MKKKAKQTKLEELGSVGVSSEQSREADSEELLKQTSSLTDRLEASDDEKSLREVGSPADRLEASDEEKEDSGGPSKHRPTQVSNH